MLVGYDCEESTVVLRNSLLVLGALFLPSLIWMTFFVLFSLCARNEGLRGEPDFLLDVRRYRSSTCLVFCSHLLLSDRKGVLYLFHPRRKNGRPLGQSSFLLLRPQGGAARLRCFNFWVLLRATVHAGTLHALQLPKRLVNPTARLRQLVRRKATHHRVQRFLPLASFVPRSVVLLPLHENNLQLADATPVVLAVLER